MKKRTYFLLIFLLLFSLFTTAFPSQAKTDFIFLNKKYATLKIGDTLQLKTIRTSFTSPVWKSSKSSIASVNEKGLITAKKAGTTVITAKINNTKAICKVTVKKTSIKLNKITLPMEKISTYQLAATVSTKTKPTWKSSKTSVVTVSDAGKLKALKCGTATITATADGSKATCKVYVLKPSITLNKTFVSLENGGCFHIKATVSSHLKPYWVSDRISVASVDTWGHVTAHKPGKAKISAHLDGIYASCMVTVKEPTVTLSPQSLILYSERNSVLKASVSSLRKPTWRSSNSRCVKVDENGIITTIHHGKANITATVDGVSATCNITVKQPTITLDKTKLTLKKGDTTKLKANISSNNHITWSCSNSTILNVYKHSGKITALKKGSAYVYAYNDGIQAKCKITVAK